jgi:hypothetical protein
MINSEVVSDREAKIPPEWNQRTPPAKSFVLEPFVKRRDAGFAHARLHQLADAVVDHGGGDARAQPEAIRQVRGHVVFAAGDVDLKRAGLAEGDQPRVEPVDQRPQAEKVQRAHIGPNREPIHCHAPR